MAKRVPVNLVHLIETWFTSGVTCIKWGSIYGCMHCHVAYVKVQGSCRCTLLPCMWTALDRVMK